MRRLFTLWRLGREDLRFLLQMLHRPNRPRWLVPALVVLALFALEPLNFALPVIGVVDDLVLLPLLLRLLAMAAGAVRQPDDRVVAVH